MQVTCTGIHTPNATSHAVTVLHDLSKCYNSTSDFLGESVASKAIQSVSCKSSTAWQVTLQLFIHLYMVYDLHVPAIRRKY